jgi:hypothetical protein
MHRAKFAWRSTVHGYLFSLTQQFVAAPPNKKSLLLLFGWQGFVTFQISHLLVPTLNQGEGEAERGEKGDFTLIRSSIE